MLRCKRVNAEKTYQGKGNSSKKIVTVFKSSIIMYILFISSLSIVL